MSKSKNASQTDDTEVCATPLYTRKAAVTVPTLKVLDDNTIYIHVRGPFEQKIGQDKVTVKDAITGQERIEYVEKTLEILPITNLNTGEMMQLVGNAVLVKELMSYKGGNQAYVGLAFEITKRKAKEGKRAKLFEIYEIEAGI